MPAPRNFAHLFTAALLLSAAIVHAETTPPADQPPSGNGTTTQPAQPLPPNQPAAPAQPGKSVPKAGGTTTTDPEELKRQVMEEVRKELDKTKAEVQEQVSLVESEADARNYDAATLKDLKQTVNLLQLHGYFRVRGNLFNNADLGRGTDPSNFTLFPKPQGTSYLGSADMRLRLNPVLRVADFISLKGQFDVLDNVVLGGNPLTEPFFAVTSTTPAGGVAAESLTSRIAAGAINVKRVWAEVQLPVGQLDFGRMGYHWGEGFFYNDGNCFDCDYGNTFDRLQFTTKPLLGHVFTIAADLLTEGQLTGPTETQSLGRPLPLQQLAAAYRFSLQVQRILSPFDQKRILENGDWALQYGLMLAWRTQGYQTVQQANATGSNPFAQEPGQNTNQALNPVKANFGEGDFYLQAQHQKLRLATELVMFGGQYVNTFETINGQATSANQNITLLQGAALLRGQHAFLKQDSLTVGLDLGFASGDKTPGMGVRTYRPGAGPNGSTVPGNIDGPQYNCNPTGCKNSDVTNFLVNPDFRIDQLMWRNLFTQITDAYFARAQVAFKPGGRASGGADDYGIDLFANFVYSQAVYASSTPSGTDSPLGFEIDAGAMFTTKDGFIAGAVAGFLIPLAGLNNPLQNQNASFAQVYRGFLGVQF